MRIVPLSSRDRFAYCDSCFVVSRVRKYANLTPEQFKALGSECEICGAARDLNIDHDHGSEEIRGLLCRSCNTGLGMFRDSPELLGRAISYLSKKKPEARHLRLVGRSAEKVSATSA